eukprot:COSAG05_NODE_401_length_10253_cov_23.087453_6_plen_1145_part_00
MKLVYDTTVDVDGKMYNLDDVCQNPAGAYVMPCLKITALDCFYEGGSVMSPQGLDAWRAQALATPGTIPSASDASFEGYLFAGLAGSYCASGVSYTTGSGQVTSTCNAAVLQAQGLAGADSACVACLGTYNATLNVTTKAGIVLSTVTAGVNAQTPYTSRPRLQAADGTKLSDSAVADAINSPCYQWEGGAVFGAINKLLVLGDQTNAANGTITNAGAYEAILPLNAGAAIVSRVASAASAYSIRGAPVTITVTQAEKILRALKAALEDSAIKDQIGLWDDGANAEAGSSLIHTAFTDDSVVDGTFANVLLDETTGSSTLMIVNYVVVMALAGLAFANCSNCVSSRATVGVLGVGIAILGFLSALGFASMIDIKWNVITLWTLPFLLVGIGVDDMFIIHLAVHSAWSENKHKGSKQVLGDALADVLVPVTLTSLTNFCMFWVMARSDLAGIYDTAYVAMIAIVLLWVAMVTSFPALIAVDLGRQTDNRGELCCLCQTVEQKAGEQDKGSIVAVVSEHVDTKLYQPTITGKFGQIVVAVLSVAAIVVCGVKMTDLPLGLELNDFFVKDTWQAQYFLDRVTYFPFWPVNMNFGTVAYHTPLAQLGMLKYFENAMAGDSISGPSTSGFVWTAAMAAWGHPQICNAATNSLVTTCGPDVSSTCTAKWYPNIYGSKLSTQGGVCADFSALPDLANFGGDMYAAYSFINQIHRSAIGENATDSAIQGDALFASMLALGVQTSMAAALAAAPCNASASAAETCVGAQIAAMPDAAKIATARATYAAAYRADSLYGPMLDAGLSATPSANGGCQEFASNTTLLAVCLTNTKGAMEDWQKDATVKATYGNLPAGHPANLGSYEPSGYTEFCPVFDLPQADFDTCVDLWHANDGTYALISPGIKKDPAGGLRSDIQYSQAGGSSTYAINLHTTDDYLKMIRDSRKECDTAPTLIPSKSGKYDVELEPIHCFMSGIPFNYWEQYLTIEDFLFETIAFAVLAAVCVAVLFLVLELILSGKASSVLKAVQAALVGAVIIACMIAVSVITVVGFIGWLDVPLSGLTAMSSLMTVGFATEFAVHITHGFLISRGDTSAERVKTTMGKLFLPTLLAFLSTVIGILLLLASDFGFVTNYVFKPLFPCIVVTCEYSGTNLRH